MAHKVDARNALYDAIVCDGVLSEKIGADAEALGCALVIGGLVSKVFEVVVAHKFVLGLGRRAGRRECLFLAVLGIALVVGRGGSPSRAAAVLTIVDIRETYSFALRSSM
jgi:hypothetical protein